MYSVYFLGKIWKPPTERLPDLKLLFLQYSSKESGNIKSSYFLLWSASLKLQLVWGIYTDTSKEYPITIFMENFCTIHIVNIHPCTNKEFYIKNAHTYVFYCIVCPHRLSERSEFIFTDLNWKIVLRSAVKKLLMNSLNLIP